jgi:enoyl-CoA hydratase
MSELISCKQIGDASHITLSRPENGNLISNPMAEDLIRMLKASEKTSKLIIFRGAGRDFCVGREGGRPPADQKLTALEFREYTTEPALRLYAAFRECKIPIIGVVQGRALGVGCSLAALCDMTLASDQSSYSFPEMTHDLPPTLAMSALLGKVSPKVISYMVYSTDEIDAAEAKDIGIISRVVAAQDLEVEVTRISEFMLGRTMPSLIAVKEYLRSAPSMDSTAFSDFASNLLANVLASK